MKFLKEWGRTITGILLCGAFIMAGCQQIRSQLMVWDIEKEQIEVEAAEQLFIKKSGIGLPSKMSPSIRSTSPNSKSGPGARVFNGGKLSLLSNQSASQMLSVILETGQGGIIVIDGGTKDDAAHLLETLRTKGGHVKAWFITHPHSDHVGALTEILDNPESGITIDQLYFSFAGRDWYETNEQYRADMVEKAVQSFQKLPTVQVHGDIAKGQVITIDDVTVTVMNQPYLFTHNSINNSSVAYRAVMDGKSILFLGDMGAEAGNQLLADYGAGGLKSDIVQMAHHGQYGVTKEVYAAIRPQICLWPTPSWLWNNDNGGGPGSGSWSTQETIQWMQELGAVSNYSIKDGDQIIQ